MPGQIRRYTIPGVAVDMCNGAAGDASRRSTKKGVRNHLIKEIQIPVDGLKECVAGKGDRR